MTWQLEADLVNADEVHDLLTELEPLALSVFGSSIQALFATGKEARIAQEHIRFRTGLQLAVSRLEEIDWLAHNIRAFPPLDVGPFVIVPEGHAPGTGLVLKIEAGTGFGTGHHATTRGCLLELAALNHQPGFVLDMGCGSAILAIAAASLWDCEVVAVDNDPLATGFARRQVEANGMAQRIRIIRADGCRALNPAHQFDLVMANILARPLIAMAPEIPGTAVILSGFLVDQVDDVERAYHRQGFECVSTTVIDDWVTLSLRKPPSPVIRAPE